MESELFNKRGMVFMGFAVLFGFMLLSAIFLSGVVVSQGDDIMEKLEQAILNPTGIYIKPGDNDNGRGVDSFFEEIGAGEVWKDISIDDILHSEIVKKLNSENQKIYEEQGLKDKEPYPLDVLFDLEKDGDKRTELINNLLESTKEKKSDYKETFQDFFEHVTGVNEVDFSDEGLGIIDKISYNSADDVIEITVGKETTKIKKDDLVDVDKIKVLEDGTIELNMKKGKGEEGGKIELKPGDELESMTKNEDGTYTAKIKDGAELTVGDDTWIKQKTDDKGNDVYEYKGKSAKVVKDGYTVMPKDDLSGEAVFKGKRLTVKNSVVDGNGLDNAKVVGDKAFSFDILDKPEDFGKYNGDGNSIGIYRYDESFWNKLNPEFKEIYDKEGLMVVGDVSKTDGVELRFDSGAVFDFKGMSSVEKGALMGFEGFVGKGEPIVIGDNSKLKSDDPGTGQISIGRKENLRPYSLSQSDDSSDPRVGDPAGSGSGSGFGGGGQQGGGGGSPSGGGEGGGESGPADPKTLADLGNPVKEDCIASADGFENCPSDPDRPWISNCNGCSGVNDEMTETLSGSLSRIGFVV